VTSDANHQGGRLESGHAMSLTDGTRAADPLAPTWDPEGEGHYPPRFT